MGISFTVIARLDASNTSVDILTAQMALSLAGMWWGDRYQVYFVEPSTAQCSNQYS